LREFQGAKGGSRRKAREGALPGKFFESLPNIFQRPYKAFNRPLKGLLKAFQRLLRGLEKIFC
jgi:hypothetical protein